MFKKLTHKNIEFTPFVEGAKLFPPRPAKECLPLWYKQMSPYIEGASLNADYFSKNLFSDSVYTIKRCLPVQDFLISGYLIFSYCEILFSEINQEENQSQTFAWSTPSNSEGIFGSHPHGQCPINFQNKKRFYLKLFSGWGIKTPKGYSTLFIQPFYHKEERFSLFPAIVDTDTYHNSIGFIGFLHDNIGNFKLETNTPLMLAIPFKREEWSMSLNTELANETKFLKLKKQFFDNVYRNFFHSKKRFD